MRIVKGVYIVSRLTFLLAIGMVYLTSLGYFFGWDLEIKNFLIYVLIIFIEVIIFTTIFLIVKKTRKKHYEFSTDMTIFLYTRENREYITSVNDVIQIFYVRFLWVLFLQIGAGMLHYAIDNGMNNRSLNWGNALGSGGMQMLSGAFAFAAGGLIGVSGFYNLPGQSKMFSSQWFGNVAAGQLFKGIVYYPFAFTFSLIQRTKFSEVS